MEPARERREDRGSIRVDLRNPWWIEPQSFLTASVTECTEVEPDLATFGSFVRYRVNEGRSMEHKLALHPRRGQEQHTISIRTARGLALLGMREGQIFTARQSQDVHESIEIEMIMFQPEADGEQLRPEAFGS